VLNRYDQCILTLVLMQSRPHFLYQSRLGVNQSCARMQH